MAVVCEVTGAAPVLDFHLSCGQICGLDYSPRWVGARKSLLRVRATVIDR
jgi:hypothetical protein